MTPTLASPSHPARRASRLVVAIGVLVGISSLTIGGADAANRTSSDSVARHAARAVSALERWEQTSSPSDYVRFLQSRETTAQIAAEELEIDPALLLSEWASAEPAKGRAVLSAMSQLGVPYRSLASKEGVGFDCSGLTIWAFAEAGVEIPRVSSDQIRAADSVEFADAEAGDLMYYPGHIGIYVGADVYVHSPNSGNLVELAKLPKKSIRFGDAVPDEAPSAQS